MMHKCLDCGTEYEGNFCPNCGKRRQDGNFCPNCGTAVTGNIKFCPNCGYSFTDGKLPAKQPVRADESVLQKVYGLLRFVPAILFILFSVLAFAFFAAPLMDFASFEDVMSSLVADFGESDDMEVSVNVYTGLSDEMFSGAAGGFLAFGFIGLFVAASACVFAFVSPVKGARVRFSERVKLPLFELIQYIGYALYFIDFLLGCIVAGKIAAFDEGAGLLKAGACPVLFIVFPILFGLFSVAATVARYFLAKNYPEWREKEKAGDEENYLNFKNAKALKAERERVRAEWTAAYRAEHPEPVPPVVNNLTKPKKPVPQTVIGRTPKLEYEVDKAVRRKRAAAWLCYFIPLVVFSWIGAIVARIKRVGYRPEKVAKHKLLSFGTWLNFSGALPCMFFGVVYWWLFFESGCSLQNHYDVFYFSLAPLFTVAAAYFIFVFVWGLRNIHRLNKLSLKLFGTRKPFASRQFVAEYRGLCEQYRADYKKYQRALAESAPERAKYRAAEEAYRADCAKYNTQMKRELRAVLKSVEIPRNP